MNKARSKLSLIWEKELGRGGSRITQPRRAILDIIAESERPLTPQEVYLLAKVRSPRIGLVTVYRTIEKLESLGFVDRVHQTEQCQTVFRGTPEHKHLLVCADCGKSVYFNGLDVEEKFLDAGKELGYQITGHWLQLSGLCPECRNEE
ncbi:MAG TPA: Fur family transcriptional regulator [Pelolinea sp.]|nr:Fur family transcriptional regulator [Pelolinea sp.]